MGAPTLICSSESLPQQHMLGELVQEQVILVTCNHGNSDTYPSLNYTHPLVRGEERHTDVVAWCPDSPVCVHLVCVYVCGWVCACAYLSNVS